MTPAGLGMCTVYFNPSDYPGKFVVRFWVVTAAGVEKSAEPMAVVDTLEEARAAIPRGAVRLDRSEHDEPVIVEVWI